MGKGKTEKKLTKKELAKQKTEQKKREKEDFEEKLIRAVQNYSFLYDSQNRDYHDKPKAARAWVQISEELGLDDIESLKKTWKYIKQKYRKFKRSEKVEGKSGDGDQDPEDTEETWIHTPILGFLDKFIIDKK